MLSWSQQTVDVAVLIHEVCEVWVKGSRCGILCGSVGSESILVRVLADWDVVFDVLENQFLKLLHQDGVRAIWHRPFRYKNDDGSIGAGANSLLWECDVKNVVITSASWSAHVFSTNIISILSGPTASCVFILSRSLLTSAVVTDSNWSSGGRVDFTAESLLRRSKWA